MKTVKEWLNELPEEIRERAISNAEASGWVNAGCMRAGDAIGCAFHWKGSPEGELFWNEWSDWLFDPTQPKPTIKPADGSDQQTSKNTMKTLQSGQRVQHKTSRTKGTVLNMTVLDEPARDGEEWYTVLWDNGPRRRHERRDSLELIPENEIESDHIPAVREMVEERKNETLSRRDQFAMAAMQGMLANSIDGQQGVEPWWHNERLALCAVMQADALIQELDKTEKA